MHRILPFPTRVAIDSEHFTPPDGIDRDTVVRLHDDSTFGGSIFQPQAVYAAYDIHGYELGRGYAVSWEKTAKVLTRLWALVDAAHGRQPKLVP